jgi:hypothetical protein
MIGRFDEALKAKPLDISPKFPLFACFHIWL